MRRPARFLLAVASLAILCGATAAPAAEHPRLAFTTIAQGHTSGVRAPVDEVIADADEWARVWAEIYAGAEPVPPLPEVDFSRRMVVFTATGDVGYGFGIEVTDVVASKHFVEVRIRETIDPGCFGPSVVTQPYHAIELDRAGPVVFRRSRRLVRC